jgi:uncharacterized protein YlxW (UPF0749 family)
MITPIWLMKVHGWLKAVGAWLKGHWFLFVLIGPLVYAAIFAKNKAVLVDQLLKEFKEQQTQNSKQLDELRRIQQEQITKQQEINQKYNEVLDRIQQNYQDQLRTLDIQKEVDLRHIIATNNDDPAAMARDINALFGIPIYPTN